MRAMGGQRGAVLIILLLVLVLGLAALLTGTFNSTARQVERGQASSRALAQAREALVADAAMQLPVTSAGFLRLPDLGFGVGNVPAEGSSSPNFSGNAKDYPVAGKLPWRTLKLQPLREGRQECLWYVVSGRFKNTPLTDALNWDTQGQLTLLDAQGRVLAEHAAALLVAPGPALDGQDRTQGDAAYAQCGGNYDARNYLDPYLAADAILGALNYFGGSSNNRVAASSGDKLLIAASGSHHNDAFLAVSSDDIFRSLIRRADFSAQVSALLDDAYFRTVVPAGSKGTDNVNCTLLSSASQAFCRNWKEMLLLTQLPAAASVILDGVPLSGCSRVLLFGGRRAAAQARLSPADKSAPQNYLEGVNLASFAVPFALSGNFGGSSVFRAAAPEADLLRCLP